MSCRNSRLSSAIVTFARDMTGLADNQVLALNHALMQEGANYSSDTETWNRSIDHVINEYRADRLRISGRSRDPLSRLESARTETPDAGRIYAAERLLARATAAATANEEYLTNYARDTGVTYQDAQQQFATAFAEATDDASRHASTEFVTAWNADANHASLFVDRRSLIAYETLERARNLTTSTSDARLTVIRQRVHSTAIAEMGWDAETGHTEIVLHSNPDRVYSYRMTREEYQEFRDAPSLGSHYARNIRNNPSVHYSSVEEAEAASMRRRCATCGQFAASVHSCIVPGSREAHEAELHAILERAQAPQEVIDSAVAASARGPRRPAAAATIAPEASPVRTIPRGHTVQYFDDTAYMRMAGITRLQSEARRGDIRFHVHGAINTQDNDPYARHVISGQVQMHYNGRGRGYVITDFEPDGSQGRSLQCDCEDYRRDYRCEHTQNLIASLNRVASGTTAATQAAASAGVAQVSPQLAAEYQASLAATTAGAAAFTPVATSFEADPAIFQGMYEEARAKREAYRAALTAGDTTAEYPVPYIRDNAFGGLASRESGRGFGIEIEYGFPNTMSYEQQREARRAIGRELYAEELTRSETQGGYGASHGWVRDHHARGWSYEDDGTTSDRENNAGGEIVSPIMYDEPETWQNIEKITAILARNGAVPTRGAGMHVHVSAGDYDHRIENHNRLLSAFAENEDLIYRLSTSPDRGRHRGTGYCRPNPAGSAPYTQLATARRAHTGHHLGLNLQSVAGSTSDHVEFRSMDSTLNPAVMQAQIGMAVYLAAGATRPGTADLNPSANHTPVGSRLDANPTRENLTGDAWNESTASFRRFIDRFVPGNGVDESENPRIRQMVSLFASTKWQRRR